MTRMWTFVLIGAVIAAAGCLAARPDLFAKKGSPDIHSRQGRTLVGALSYHWSHVMGIGHIPRLAAGSLYRTVLIDPGHGGKDPGARGVDGLVEKDIVLDIGLRLKVLLEKNGIRAHLTRDRDVFLSLEERVELMKRYHPDLFLSLHVNSHADTAISGLEVYYAQEEVYWAAVHNALTDAVRDTQVMTMIDSEDFWEYRDDKKIIRDRAARAARHLADDLSAALGSRNRGVKREQFHVLSEASVPSVLVELGFVTNPEEGRKLGSEQYRRQAAETIAQSLLNVQSGP